MPHAETQIFLSSITVPVRTGTPHGIGTPEGSTWGVREAGATPYIISKGVMHF